MNPSQSTASVLPLNPQMLDLLPAAVDLCDAEGVLRYYNRRAAELWGREPRCGDGGERFCGAFRLFRPDGSPLDHAATPMADALRTGQATWDGEVIMERPDGSRVTVMIESEAIRDGDGHIIGAIDVFQDITERKRLFDELRRGEERLRRLLSALPAAVYTTDQEGRITFVNAAAAELWGRLPDIGQEMWCGSFRMFRPDGTPLPHDQCPMAVALREGRSVPGQEIVVERSDGTRVCALPHPVPLRDDSGEVIGAVNMLVDISDRKRAEEQLRESEARFRAIVEATPDCVKLVSPDGTLLEMNPAGLGMLEVDRAEDILGRCLYDVIAPEQREAYREFNERVCAGVGGTLEFDIVGLRGTRRKMETRAVPLRDARGRLICGAVTRDVSQRKRVDAALRASEEKYRTLADNVQQLFWICLPDGRCDYLSRQWVDYTGIPEAEQLGLYWLPLVIHPEDQGRTLTAWMKALEDGLYDLEYRIRGADGRYRWFKTRGTPIRDDRGTITKWFGTCTDIDDQKRAEEALKENDRRKDEFLAMLAHELRNPLAAISNAVQVAKRSASKEPQEWSQKVVENQLRHLSRLIDDLLDVSRITRGKIRLRKEKVNVIPVLEHALEAVKPLVEERRHELSASFDHAMWVEADPTRLEQIAVNLLTNAAKYTPNGGEIRLTARREGGEIALVVKDNGVGIPPERLPQMFELFAQGDHSLARSEGGLGIGLTIGKDLVAMHGGTVAAASGGVGAGCEFVVRLPAIAPPASRPDVTRPPRESNGRRARILLVDDNIDTARGMGRLLNLLGHDVRTAHDGPSALEAAREYRPEYVPLDIGLPGMDGYEVARRLREDEWCKDVVIVAISGYGQEEDRRRSKQAGIDHHLVKPIDHEALVMLLSRVQ